MAASVNDLSFPLSPKSIAIVGASGDAAKVNGRTLRYLLAKGYAGAIYPVNPKYPRIGALACYPTAAEIPEAVDLAVIAVPAALVPQALDDLGRRGAKAAIAFSSGFSEMGEDGRALEQQVVATAIAALARQRGMGLGYFVNTGNEGDVDFVAAMRAVLADPRITVGAGYLEGLKDGVGLMALAERALSEGKPLVLTKVGRTRTGARAAASHTGSLAGVDEVFNGVIRGAGLLRARNEEHMLDMVEVLSKCVRPEGRGWESLRSRASAGC